MGEVLPFLELSVEIIVRQDWGRLMRRRHAKTHAIGRDLALHRVDY